MASRLRPLLWLSLFLCATSNERPVEIVLARCRENIDWVEDFGYGNITTVYDKCGTTAGPGHNVERPNVGREGGTFLHPGFFWCSRCGPVNSLRLELSLGWTGKNL